MEKGVKFITDLGMKKPNENSLKKHRYYLVKCLHCNKEFEQRADWFKKAKSCQKCAMRIRPKKDSGETHGLTGIPLYMVWASVKARCNKPKACKFKNYGGRGIKICETWEKSFEIFYNWSLLNGYEKGLQLDRIDNDGDYEPENCRWVTSLVNNNNMSRIRTNNKTGYTGVSVDKKNGRFVSKIYMDRKQKNLGSFPTTEEASRAYEKAREEKLLKIGI